MKHRSFMFSFISSILFFFIFTFACSATPITMGEDNPITIRAARILDGRGGVIENGVIEVLGSKIIAVDTRKGPVTYDLGQATLMPGIIDVHVHLNWYFGPNGKFDERNEPPGYADQAIAENARATLIAGITTVQSLGWSGDIPLRKAINSGKIIGPRILTSYSQLEGTDSNGVAYTPDELREQVRQAKANGADVIKLFASASLRDGGKLNVSQEQINAVCGEANTQGLRSLVHAHSADSIIASVKGGCSEIEHGLFADDQAIKIMKEANVFFDPNIGLVLQNYLENRSKYIDTGNFTKESFVIMEKALPILNITFKKALAAGLRMPMGTDAVAGAHGQNAREVMARVSVGGQAPMDAIIGATSLNAESLGLGNITGTIAPGYDADIIAVNGNPLEDIVVLRVVTFVMKGGQIFKKVTPMIPSGH